jgi:hypothetical protein
MMNNEIDYFYIIKQNSMRQILCLLMLGLSISTYSQNKSISEQLAQQQLDAYNNRDIEAFLVPYSDSIEVYDFPNTFQYKGKEKMRKGYAGMFTDTPDLHCTLKNRMVIGNTVIDQESVIFNKKNPPLECMAIYTIKDGKIAKVHFIVPKKME